MMQPPTASSSSPPKPISSQPAPQRARNGNGGKKLKQDVNHLLGFTLLPRAPPPSAGPRRSSKRNPNHGVYDKQRYVSSTFRMVVNPASDYTALFADPDLHIAWDDILQIIVDTPPVLISSTASTSSASVDHEQQHTCPICLSEPTAPRMTRCGHIFCLPCMLHYLALAEGPKWRKCPVCWDPVYSKDLKPVHYHVPSPVPATPTPSSSSSDANYTILHMRLLRRPPLTTLALPRSSTWPSPAVQPLQAPWNFTPDALTFAKFMLGSPDYMLDSFEQEGGELRRELRAGAGELEAVFISSALERVGFEVGKILELKGNGSVMGSRKRAVRELDEVLKTVVGEVVENDLPRLEETSSSEVEEDSLLPTAASTSPNRLPLPPFHRIFTPSLPPLNSPIDSPTTDSDSYFFYQSSTGAHIFLQPLDIRILKSHFGSYASMPSLLSIPISAYDEGSMNEDLRKRCKWLNHIPLGADVVFVEAELEGVVGKGALEPFNAAIRARKGKRKEKGRKEDREKVKSEIREKEKVDVLRSTATTSTWRSGGGDQSFYSSNSGGVLSNAFDFPLAASSSHPSSNRNDQDESQEEARQQPPTWGSRTFASSVLRPQSSTTATAAYEDEEFEERWHAFEDNLRGCGAGGGMVGSRRSSNSNSNGGAGSSSGANAGGGVVLGSGSSGGRKKGKKLVISLTAGAGGRGSA